MHGSGKVEVKNERLTTPKNNKETLYYFILENIPQDYRSFEKK